MPVSNSEILAGSFLIVLSEKKNKTWQLKAICCSFRSPGFDSQHPVNGSQVSVTTISVDPITEEVFFGHQAQCGIHIYI